MDRFDMLHKETSWNIIITCFTTRCPQSEIIPINRYVPMSTYQQTAKNLVEIINNPDFDRFEYLKYLKLDNSNSTSLANKTIHILPNKMSINLLESIMLVLSARPSIKIVLDFSRMVLAQSERFWKYFWRRSEILNKMNIEIVSTMLQNIDMSQETNNLYIILDSLNSNTVQKLMKSSEVNSSLSLQLFRIMVEGH